MTPVYLMQQQNNSYDIASKNEARSTKGVKVISQVEKERKTLSISPYSLSTYMEAIIQKFPEANVTEEILGRTISYNNILLIKVSEQKSEVSKYFRADDSKYMDEVPEKKIVFIVHGLSVMGWEIVPCLNRLDKLLVLLKYYFRHLDKFDIYLMPMANPDGVAMRKDLWNKNAAPQSSCSGVSLDRNFDVAWNSTRAVSPCSQQFPGTNPFSEPETRAVRSVFHRYSHKIIAYLHVHAGTYSVDVYKGDAVLYPKGFTEIQSDDDKYIDLRGEVDEAMKNASFQIYAVSVDTLYNWYGKVTGTSVDYAATIYGIPYAMELVMQPYENDPLIESEEAESNAALTEVWQRIITVIFNNIYRTLHANDVN